MNIDAYFASTIDDDDKKTCISLNTYEGSLLNIAYVININRKLIFWAYIVINFP